MSQRLEWRHWGGRAFEEAAAGGKPVLLSLVTAWSDECASMDRTTYADPEVLALVAERFVAVRVDADGRPDVNERYNLGGWPTTAFLTSRGDVLNGATHLDAAQMVAMLRQVSQAWRDRSAELLSRATAAAGPRQVPRVLLAPDASAVDYFRALLIDRFDPVHGGFGRAPKLPHAAAMMLALALDAERSSPDLSSVVEITLERMGALWDPAAGGFRRYADAEDWSRPGPEKTLEDNAALLQVYVEAAMRRQSEDSRSRAAEIVRWVKATLADAHDGGFYNAHASTGVDRNRYVDRNASMVSAFIRAAWMFEDPWLRDFALKSLEAVVLACYTPGGGVAHSASREVTGLLGDQVQLIAALIWAHAATAQLPYSMLAAELAQFAIRTMWDDEADSFRDRASENQAGEIGLLREPAHPFGLNCEAACVLARLSRMTGNIEYHDRAVAILRALAPEYRRQDLFGAPYALAVREVVEGKMPLGLELEVVDWGLG